MQNARTLSRCLSEPTLSREDLAENEHRFRQLVESLPDAIVVHTEGTIVFVNPFAVRLYAAEKAERLLGHNISEFIEPERLPLIERRIEQCHATGLASAPMETMLTVCDGTAVEVEAVAIPISWNGAPAIEVVLRDIRKRKQAEQAADA
jgi:PAS domain S-box-containing protein